VCVCVCLYTTHGTNNNSLFFSETTLGR